MRCLLVVLDGPSGHGHPQLGGRTPPEVASTPNLDRLAALGATGLYHPWIQGVALPSELAHFLMFGYCMEEFPGRGLIEALGEGIEVEEGEVVLLAKVLSVAHERDLLLVREEDLRVDEGTAQALREVLVPWEAEGVRVEFFPTRGLRGILRLEGEASPLITDSNPLYPGRPLLEVSSLERKERDPATLKTCRVLNRLSGAVPALREPPEGAEGPPAPERPGHPEARHEEARGVPPRAVGPTGALHLLGGHLLGPRRGPGNGLPQGCRYR